MDDISLLVVEDDSREQANWERVVERHNGLAERDGGTRIQLTLAGSKDAAFTKLAERNIDAAVVDLRLDGAKTDPDDAGGNAVLRAVLEAEPAVVAVFTGEPAGVIVPEFAAAQVNVIQKGAGEGEGTAAVMQWLQRQTGLIYCIKSARNTIQREIAKVFSHSVWPRWKFWIEEASAQDSELLSAAVARHITSHVHERLSQQMRGSAHAEEWYLLPPDPSGFHTGDLIRSTDGKVEIIVTPRCDFATMKFDTIQLAFCENISEQWDAMNAKVKQCEQAVEMIASKDKDAKKQARDELGKAKSARIQMIAHGGNKVARHFLPRMKLADGAAIGPFLVRFDRVRWIAKPEPNARLPEDEQRFATLSPVFLPSLVERLGAFFSRIGTPNYYHFEEVTGEPDLG